MVRTVKVIEEQFIQINLLCRPLGRTRYTYDEVRKTRLRKRSDGTNTLLAAMREKERREDEAARHEEHRPHDEVHAEYTNALSEFSPAYEGFSKSEIAETIEEEQQTDAEKPTSERKSRHHLKQFKSKVDAAIFDYSEIEQEKIEEEINALVNADGFYDEVKPVDANEEYEQENPINKTVILLIGVLVAFLAASALYFYFIF